MSHPMAEWAVQAMNGIEESIVPVKRLWYMHCEESEIPQVTPEELGSILKCDPRFYYVEDSGQKWEDSEEETLKLEKMGFFKGAKVILQTRMPSRQDLFDAITRNLDKMMLNLRKAYEIRPKDNDQTEDELIDVMLKVDQLKKEILKTMNDEVPNEETFQKTVKKEEEGKH
jgi:hypothetical protein